MKKCSYCGKEYPEEATVCLIDGEPVSATETQSSPVPELMAIAATNELPQQALAAGSAASWTEKQLLTIEVVLVCLVAFGVAVLSSFHALQFHGYGSSGSGTEYTWGYAVLRESAALGLVWYLLLRRGKSFADLGLKWGSNATAIVVLIGVAILLRIGGNFAGDAVYFLLYHAGLTDVSHKEASAYVHNYLFGGGIFWTTRLFALVNPFFEELIVRAYLMTQVKLLTNSWTKAILVSTALQTSYHLYQGTPMALAHGATFLLWSFYYANTNRVLPIVLAHLFSDVWGLFSFSVHK